MSNPEPENPAKAILTKLTSGFLRVSLRPSNAIEDPLYHYTTARGLFGIIASSSLWATNFSYLNDATEVHYGMEVLKTLLEREMDLHLTDGFGPVLAATLEGIERVFSDSEFYLTCFCAKADLLSQWRGYGSLGGRYCIALDSMELDCQSWWP